MLNGQRSNAVDNAQLMAVIGGSCGKCNVTNSDRRSFIFKKFSETFNTK